MRNKKKTGSRFWVISALLHGIVLIILILTPAGQRVLKQEERPLKPEIIRKDEELAEVIDDIRDLAVTRLKTQVSLIEAGRERMATNFDTMNKHYQPFVAGQIASAKVRLLQEGEKTIGLQKDILQAARNAVEKKEHGSDPMWRVYDKNRAALMTGQEEIRRVLLLTAPEDKELIALQDQAEAAQMGAFQALSTSVGAQNELWSSSNRLQTLSQQKAKLEEELAAAEKLSTELQTELTRLRAEEETNTRLHQEAQKNLEEAKKRLEAARKEKAGEEEARQALKMAEAVLRPAQLAASKSKDQRVQTERKLKTPASQIEARKKSLIKNAEDSLKAKEPLSTKEAERDTQAALAVTLQEQAIAHQTDVYQRLIARLDQQAKTATDSPSSPEKKKP